MHFTQHNKETNFSYHLYEYAFHIIECPVQITSNKTAQQNFITFIKGINGRKN